jgi:hypothetical protein
MFGFSLIQPYGVMDFSHQLTTKRLRLHNFNLSGHRVWGATAMILSELTTLFQDIGLT